MPNIQPKALFPILLVNFIGTMGYSIVLPFLIIIVLKFGGNEYIYGALGATYSFFQLIGAPILGRWSDRIGRRKVLLLSQIGTFLAWLIFIIALMIGDSNELSKSTLLFISLPLGLLFLARALDGITGGNVSVANAYLADITPENDRKKNFGRMAVAANLGFIIGPAIAGLLGSTPLGEILPVAMALLISSLAILVIYFLLEESNPCVFTKPIDESVNRKLLGQEHKECHKMIGESDLTLREVMRKPTIAPYIVLYFLVFLAFNLYYVAFPVHASTQLEWTVLELGVFFSIMSGLMVIVQGPLLTQLSSKYKDEQLAIIGSCFLILGFALFTTQEYWQIGIAVSSFAIGNGLMWPSFLSMLSKKAGSQQGAIQGIASSAGSLASIIGLLGGGLLYGLIGANIFLLASAVMLIILGYMYWVFR